MRPIFLTALLLLPAAAADAKNVVPKGADLVAQLDLAALKRHPVFKEHAAEITASINEKKDKAAAAVLKAVSEKLQRVTLWGDIAKEHVALYAEGVDPAIANMVIELAKADGAKASTQTYKGKSIQTFRGKKKQDESFHVVVGKTSALISNHLPTLKKGMDVLDGRRAGIDPKSYAQASVGSILMVAVLTDKLLERVRKEADSDFLKKGDLKYGMFALGAKGTDTLLQVKARFAKAEKAKSIAQILQGIIAIGAMQVEDPDVRSLISQTKVDQKGGELSLGLSLSEAQLRALIKEAAHKHPIH